MEKKRHSPVPLPAGYYWTQQSVDQESQIVVLLELNVKPELNLKSGPWVDLWVKVNVV